MQCLLDYPPNHGLRPLFHFILQAAAVALRLPQLHPPVIMVTGHGDRSPFISGHDGNERAFRL